MDKPASAAAFCVLDSNPKQVVNMGTCQEPDQFASVRQADQL